MGLAHGAGPKGVVSLPVGNRGTAGGKDQVELAQLAGFEPVRELVEAVLNRSR
jgi:hypothetical protein